MDMLTWKLGCLTCVLNLIMQFCKLEIGIIDNWKKEKKEIGIIAVTISMAFQVGCFTQNLTEMSDPVTFLVTGSYLT